MQSPLQIAFEGVDRSDSIEERIRQEASSLDQIDQRITSARIVVAKSRHRHHKGEPYQIRIHLTVPGAADINVTHESSTEKHDDDILVAIHHAFRAAHRRLEDMLRKRDERIKTNRTVPND
jgi:ribosome-associated translation inhibitor RaiA